VSRAAGKVTGKTSPKKAKVNKDSIGKEEKRCREEEGEEVSQSGEAQEVSSLWIIRRGGGGGRQTGDKAKRAEKNVSSEKERISMTIQH
jgi:hypothetical protein